MGGRDEKMKFLWVIGRTILLLLVSASIGVFILTKVYYSGSLVNQTMHPDDVKVLSVALIVLPFLLYALYFYEKKHSKKYDLLAVKKFYFFELFLCTSIALAVSYASWMFKKNMSASIIIYSMCLIFIVLLPLLKKRKNIVHISEEESKFLSDEMIREAKAKILEINHQYDTKTGSVYFQTKYSNKRSFLKNSHWRGAYSDIKAEFDFEISRPLSSMSHREREACRILKLADIAGLNHPRSQNLHAPLVWANGKGIIGKSHWILNKLKHVPKSIIPESNNLVESVTGAIEWFMKNIVSFQNFDSAVSGLLESVDALSIELPDHPAVLEMKRRLDGGNAWLGSDRFNDTGFRQKQPAQGGIFLGKMPDRTECWFTGQGAIMTIAPPGSGKTQTHIIPNLLKWKGSAVVLDVKGELWDKTAGYRAKHVGKVYRFAPLDPDHSHCFNPLALVRNDPDYLWGDAKFLASMIAISNNPKDAFWESKARELITSAIAVECMMNDSEDRDMATVVGYCYGRNWAELIARLEHSSVNAMKNAATSLLKSTHDKNQATLGSIQMQAQSYMSAWEGARVERATKTSHWHPNDLRDGNITIYIGLKAGEIDTYAGLLRIFIAQHIRTLIQELPNEDSSDILFMLDEFPRLKFMSEIEEALEIGRQYKIKLFLAVQSTGQVKQHYKNAEGLIGACAIRAFMNPSSQDGTAEKITKELGYTESIVDGARKNIAETTDLTGAEYANDVIILTSGTKPIRAKKSFAYQDEELSNRMDVEPPNIGGND